MSARYTRQNYKDVDPLKVDPQTYPIVQLKFDGIWGLAEVTEDNYVRIYSRNGECKKEYSLDAPTRAGCYIGEFMYGSEWSKEEGRSGRLFLFDLIELESTDLRRLPYATRYAHLQESHRRGWLPTGWSVIPNHPSSETKAIWEHMVESKRFEGLVFRKPDDAWDVTLQRAKHEQTFDLRITGYVEGTGRLTGTLGALLAERLEGGPQIRVGGGLSDGLRRVIWNTREQYLGRIFECTCKKVFASGLLRHANFVRWHSDKK